MKKNILIIFSLSIVINACIKQTVKNDELKLASEFTEGLVEVASDKIVFLELLAAIDWGSCPCATLEQPLPSYLYSSNFPRIRVLNELILDKSTDINTLLSSTAILIGKKGLLGNQLYLADINSFETFPLELKQHEKRFSIYSADQNGIIVAKTPDGIYFIESGQTWYSQASLVSGEPEDCNHKITYELVNHGFIDKTSIQYLDENELALESVY